MPFPTARLVALLTVLAATGLAQDRPSASLVRPPLRFVENRGQWDPSVEFAMLGGGSGWVHADGWTVRFERRTPAAPGGGATVREASGAIVRTRFRAGAGHGIGEGLLPGVSNFMLGRDERRWVKGLPGYRQLTLHSLLPGVDAVLRPLEGDAACFEYDLQLGADADLERVVADLEGIDRLELAGDGSLRASVRLHDGAVLQLQQRPPLAWVDGPQGRQRVPVAFRLLGQHSFGFVSPWRGGAPLCIDPGVLWSTLLGGGSSDSVNSLKWRAGVGIAVGGWAGSTDFPTTPGAFRVQGGQDGFVALLREDGTALQWATYLGGSLTEEVRGVDFGPGNSIAAVGFTTSADFPVTAGALQPAYGGASPILAIGDGFVARLDATGSTLIGSTYLGASLDEVAESVAVDAAGASVVAGWTSSPDFHTTPGVYQPQLGGPVTLQPDGFVARVSADARTLHFATYLGGGLPDQLFGVALDSQGRATVVGNSISSNFPTTIGAFQRTLAGGMDAYVAWLHPNGGSLLWSTYLGGPQDDMARAVALGPNGAPFVVGTTMGGFPVTSGAPQPTFGGGTLDAFACWYDQSLGSISFATYFGGRSDDVLNAIAIPPTGLVALGGWTWSSDWPATTGSLQTTLHGIEDGNVTVLDLLTDLAGGLSIGPLPAPSADAFQPDTDVRALAIELRNNTVRAVEVHSLRVFVGGKGDNRDLASLSLWRDPAGTGAGPGLSLLSGPLPPPAENGEVTFAVPALQIAPAASVALVVTFRTAPGCPAGAEYSCNVVAFDAWNASAVGVGNGPRLALMGSSGLYGLALPCRERIGFQGDDDGDGLITIADLRRLASHVGQPAVHADPDGDGVITSADLDLLQAWLLNRPIVRSVPAVLQRGGFTSIRGFGLGALPTATVGGRVLTPAAISDQELCFRIDGDLPVGSQELRVMLGQRLVVVQPVQVQ